MNIEFKKLQRKAKRVVKLKNRGTMSENPKPKTIQTRCEAVTISSNHGTSLCFETYKTCTPSMLNTSNKMSLNSKLSRSAFESVIGIIHWTPDIGKTSHHMA